MVPFKLCFITKYLWFSLRNNNIGSKGAKFLAEALKMNQALVSLKWAQLFFFLHSPSIAQFNTTILASLQSNGIEEAGAEALAEVLQCNRKLVTLKWADFLVPFSWFHSCITTVFKKKICHPQYAEEHSRCWRSQKDCRCTEDKQDSHRVDVIYLFFKIDCLSRSSS